MAVPLELVARRLFVSRLHGPGRLMGLAGKVSRVQRCIIASLGAQWRVRVGRGRVEEAGQHHGALNAGAVIHLKSRGSQVMRYVGGHRLRQWRVRNVLNGMLKRRYVG